MSTEDRLRDALKSIIEEDPPRGLVSRSVARLPPRRSSRFAWLRTTRATVAGGLALVVVTAVVASAVLLRPDRGDGQGVAAASPSATEGPTVAATPAPAPGSASPTATLAPTPIAVPTVTAQPPPSAAPTVTGGPTTTPDDDERSDRFWESVTDFAPYSLTYDSLADITREAHLVVRGRLVGLTTGTFEPFEEIEDIEDFGPMEWTFGVVEIDEVLKGDPVTKVPGTVQVAGLVPDGVTIAELPDDEVILFLMNWARQREEGGYAPADNPDDIYYYERPNRYQCVLRNTDGVVEIVQGPPGSNENLGPYPWSVDGEPFEQVAERIREISQELE